MPELAATAMATATAGLPHHHATPVATVVAVAANSVTVDTAWRRNHDVNWVGRWPL